MLEKCPRCNSHMFEFEKDRWKCVKYMGPFARKNSNGELSDGECDFFFDKDGYELC